MTSQQIIHLIDIYFMVGTFLSLAKICDEHRVISYSVSVLIGITWPYYAYRWFKELLKRQL